ncbi:hypothetical protein EWM64_g10661 [Hericium alpestre]|uniref:NAD-dependent epimerase/dehydratase domain-containing protein n=1 Tax=Hericium alpestre TaxID=135208 RepID=A0A4Y9ZHQ7_9AGAM|nr:hypothetical protein EWM64_g10661 [Hericium alpestre]
MPAVSAPAKVLVTGANGFLAVWVVRTLLEQGYSVRGTVRSAKKGEHVRALFGSYGNKLELVVVEDITKAGAFDEAVKGVDVVEHTASPWRYSASEPNDFIIPAVKGTVGVLESIRKHAPSVKRVIITASMASVLESFGKNDPVIRYDETSWNNSVLVELEKNPLKLLPVQWYCASKMLAEKAAWDFVEEHKSEINFDLTVLNPPYIYGPVLDEVPSPEKLNQSLSELYNIMIQSDATTPYPEYANGWIDVRDAALAHVLAASTPAAGGNRFIIAAGTYHFQEILDTANAINPPIVRNLVKGTPGTGREVSANWTLDTSKVERVLGIKWRPLQETIADTLADWKQKGFAA